MKELELQEFENVWTRMQNLESEKDEIVFWKVGESEAVFAKRVEGQFQVFEMESSEFDQSQMKFDEEDLEHLKSIEESSSDDWDALKEVVKEVYSRGGTIVVQDASDLKQVDVVVKAKVLRRELSLRFPDQKFSVKTDRYTGGSSINVEWTDGVAEEDVQQVTRMYQFVYDDQDLQSGYHHDDNKVFTRRNKSEEAKKLVESEILDKFAEGTFKDQHWNDNRFTSEFHQKFKKTSFKQSDDSVEMEA